MTRRKTGRLSLIPPGVLLLLLAFAQGLIAQSGDRGGLRENIEFERLSVEHGLSQSTVNCILQDRAGYMWFGTLNGLNKYDGYTFVDFRHNPNDPNSISNDQVLTIFEDHDGDLWIGTQDGLNRLDRETHKFTVYKHDPLDLSSLSNNLVRKIYEDKAGVLWVGTGFGLNRLDKDSQKFTGFYREPNGPISLTHNAISAIFEDKDNNLWVGTYGGLNKLDASRTQLTHYIQMARRSGLAYVPGVMRTLDETATAARRLAAILEVGNSRSITKKFEISCKTHLLIISVGEGTDKMHDYGWLEQDGQNIWQMELDRTRHAGGSSKNRIEVDLVTLERGSYTLRYRSDDSHCFSRWNQLPPLNPTAWGIQVIPISENEVTFFESRLRHYLKPSVPSANSISSITQDADGDLWIGTYGGGLNKLAFGAPTGFVTRDTLLSGMPQDSKFARFTHYLASEQPKRKNYASDIFNWIRKLTASGSRIAAILKVGDSKTKKVDFEIRQGTKILVVGMGEGSERMYDYARLVTGKQVVWQMQPEETYHAGGALSNRLQIDVLDLPPGTYQLQYCSDDLHSYGKWNKLPPHHDEFWGVQVFKISGSEANKIAASLNVHSFSNGIPSNTVKAIHFDQGGDLWMATFRGLSRFNEESGFFTNFEHDPKDAASLSSNDLQTVYEDRSGTIWIGTVLGGINKLNRTKNRFPRFTANPFIEHSLTNKVVYSFYEDPKDLIWVGTRGGVSLFERQSGRFFSDPGLEQLAGYAVLAITADHFGHVWVGTQGGGLFRFDPKFPYRNSNGHASELLTATAPGKSRGVTRYLWQRNDRTSIGSNSINAIHEDRDGILWVGTDGGGLNRLETDGKTFIRHLSRADEPGGLSDNTVKTIYEDATGLLWLGTPKGLNRFDKNTGRFEHFRNNPGDTNSLSHNTVTSIYEDENRIIWVATYGGGLNRFDRDTNKFVRFTEKDGLPNNIIYSILPDGLGNLWLSTNKGLSQFSLAGKKVRNFDLDNGLQSNEFNTGAYFKCRDGSLLFGGINGFNIVEPARIQNNPSIPAIVITNFKKYDQPVKFDKAISELDQIELSYDESFISFEFAALDYSNPGKNQYAYKLQGFDEDWIYCGNRRYASYTNLDPGDYIFQVKGSNNDGVWNEQGAHIRIFISPPFWATWWFVTTVSVVFLIALLTAHRYRVRHKIKQSMQMERIRFLEREKVREQVARDYHDELGHKLTKISLFSELIKRNLNGGSQEIKQYLDRVIRSSESLSSDTRDFIWTLNPEKDNLYDLALYLKEFGDSLFEGTDICFQIKPLSERLKFTKVPMEWKRQLTLIFKEGMNNVVKHSGCRKVTLKIELTNRTFVVKLIDDGRGFNTKEKIIRSGTGNGLYNMKTRAQKITGELTVNSTPGEGTKIIFDGKLPTNGYFK